MAVMADMMATAAVVAMVVVVVLMVAIHFTNKIQPKLTAGTRPIYSKKDYYLII